MAYHRKTASFREIDHTADTGLIVEGASLGDLFANAAYGMIHLLFGGRTIGEQMHREFHLTETTAEELLVSWLSEINYQFLQEDFIAASFPELNITDKGDCLELRAVASGDAVDGPEKEIKAVTYHKLYIRKLRNGRFEARVIFDI